MEEKSILLLSLWCVCNALERWFTRAEEANASFRLQLENRVHCAHLSSGGVFCAHIVPLIALSVWWACHHVAQHFTAGIRSYPVFVKLLLPGNLESSTALPSEMLLLPPSGQPRARTCIRLPRCPLSIRLGSYSLGEMCVSACAIMKQDQIVPLPILIPAPSHPSTRFVS